MSDMWSHSHEWDNGYAKGHKDGYEHAEKSFQNSDEWNDYLDEIKKQIREKVLDEVFAKINQPNKCLFNNASECCYPIDDCMNCPIAIDEMKHQKAKAEKCKWKYEISPLSKCLNWQITCGRRESVTRLMPNYKYCPSCGKKIEFEENKK